MYELHKQQVIGAEQKLRHAETFENRVLVNALDQAKSVGVSEIIMVPSMFWGLGKARNMKNKQQPQS